jgi:hypothetical protein
MTANAEPEPTNDQAPKPEAAPAPKPAASGGDETKRLKSELSGVHEQLHEFKTKAEAAQAELDKINADKVKAAEALKLDQGKQNEIIEARNKTIAEYETTIANMTREALISDAASRLVVDAEGKTLVASSTARRAMAADWAAKTPEERNVKGAFEAFIEAQRKDDPAAFGSGAAPVAQPGAGTVEVGNGETGDLKTRLASADDKIRIAAQREEFGLIASGKLEQDWDRQ